MRDLEGCAKIVSLDEFAKISAQAKREGKKVVVTSGGYDPIHPGHITGIMASKKYGDILGVLVNGDEFLVKKKGAPFMPIEVRCQIVSAIRDVDYVVPFDAPAGDQTVKMALERIKPAVFTKGGDRVNRSTIPEWGVCGRHNIQIVSGVGDPKIHSSSDFLANWVHRHVIIQP